MHPQYLSYNLFDAPSCPQAPAYSSAPCSSPHCCARVSADRQRQGCTAVCTTEDNSVTSFLHGYLNLPLLSL